MSDLDVRTRFRREAGLRARVPFLNLKRPLLPVPEVTLLLDSEGRIVRLSAGHAGETLRQIPFAEGGDVHKAFHPSCNAQNCRFIEDWEQAWTSHRSGLPVEWLYLADDSEIVVKLRLQPVSFMCGQLFADSIDNFASYSVLFVQDLTQPDSTGLESAADTYARNADLYEKRRATDPDPALIAALDDRLRQVTSRLITVRDDVCKRLAADLHDGLGQTLSLLRLEIESIAAKQEGEEHTDSLARIVDHARRAQRELRHISNELFTGNVGAAALSDSLAALVKDFRAAKPNIELIANVRHFEPDVPTDLSVTIYRIAQEALHNVMQHSAASKATLALTSVDGGIQLQISDNGKGFSPLVEKRHGLGLITIRERAEKVGGQYDISSEPGNGCTVRVTWPPEMVASLR